MPLTLVHTAVSVPPTAVADSRDFPSRAAVAAQIATAANGAAHAVAGATAGDILIATSPVTLGVITAPATGRVLISQGAGVAPVWSTSGPAGLTLNTPDLTGTTTAATILASASIKSSQATTNAGIGYATGAGSTVTQLTSKSTGVTLNTICGQITMNGAALGATTSVAFTFTNSTIEATDVVIVNLASGNSANSYFVSVDAVSAGSCSISLRNYTAGSLSEAVVLNFAVIKSVTA